MALSDYVDVDYIDTLSVEELRHELKLSLAKEHALRKAFKKVLAVPDPLALNALNSLGGKFSRDWERGKAMQRNHGLEAIPPNTECEIGAGLWSRIHDALLST